MQCSAVQCSAVQCGAVQCGTVRCGALRCGVVRCGAMQCNAVCGRVWCVACGSVQCEVGSAQCTVCGVRCAVCGVRSAECGVWSVRCGAVLCDDIIVLPPHHHTSLKSSNTRTQMTHFLEPSSNKALKNCTWYSSQTCCSQDDSERISQENSEIELSETTRSCRDLLHSIQCSICSPQQEQIFLMEQV